MNRQMQEESRLKAEAEAAAKKAEKVDPFEAEQSARVQALADWESGKAGPIDVRKMPGSGVGLSLFAEAKRMRDAGRVGRGLASLESGANTAFATALDRETQLERDLAASAGLEDYVTGRLADLDARMLGLAATSDARNLRVAGLTNNRYANYLQRPRETSFLKQLALGGLSAAGNAFNLTKI